MPGVSKKRLREFAGFVEEATGKLFPEADLQGALGAVRLRTKQEGGKLSPVERTPAGKEKRDAIRAVSPYCAATYTSFESCPRSCTFLTDPLTGTARGCFVAANVNQRRATQRLDLEARLVRPSHRRLLIALAEAFEIRGYASRGVPQDGHRGGRDLRLHVSGDALGDAAASSLAEAAREWVKAGGGSVWTFTHAWRVTPRAAWGDISVLASVETIEAAQAAHLLGYAVAIAVPRVRGQRAYVLDGLPDVRVVPCPAERGRSSGTSGQSVTCVTCRLCLDDVGLRKRKTMIAFEAHSRAARAARRSMSEVGEAANRVRRSLPVLS